MLKRSSRHPMLLILSCMLLAVLLASCTQGSVSTPTATIPPTRNVVSATRTPAARVNPNDTPVPLPVTTSALADIRQRGELRVGVLYNASPFCFLADNGEVRGYEVDLVRHIAEGWQVEVKFVQVTRQTRLPMLYGGEVDMLAAAMPHRRELEQFVDFTSTTFRSGFVVLVSADSGVDSIAAIGAGPVAAVGNEAQRLFTEYAGQQGVAPSVQLYSSVAEAVAAFKSSSVSAIVGRREDMMLASSSLPNTEILNETVMAEPYAFAVRRGDTPLRDLLNLALLGLAGSGDIGTIFSANFYGYAADLFPVYPGESSFTFQTFPADITPVESEVDRIKRGEPLRVAGLALVTNPGRFDSQTIVDGYNRAIVNEMARRWNVPVSELPQSAGQAGIDLLKSGQADLVVGIRPDLSLIGQVSWSQPYYQRSLRLVHMAGVTVLGIGSLGPNKVTVTEPFSEGEDLIKDNSGAADIEQASYEDGFQALTLGSTYAMVGDEFSMMLMIQTDDRIEIIGKRYRPMDYTMAISLYDTDFQALVDFALQDMKRDGTLDRLREQYFNPYIPADDPLEPLEFEIWPGDGSYLGVGG